MTTLTQRARAVGHDVDIETTWPIVETYTYRGEVKPRRKLRYRIECSCGWSSFNIVGFDTAKLRGREHLTQALHVSADSRDEGSR